MLFCNRVLGHCRESLVLTAGKSSPQSSWVPLSVSETRVKCVPWTLTCPGLFLLQVLS